LIATHLTAKEDTSLVVVDPEKREKNILLAVQPPEPVKKGAKENLGVKNQINEEKRNELDIKKT
jgi:hypothetical protein